MNLKPLLIMAFLFVTLTFATGTHIDYALFESDLNATNLTLHGLPNCDTVDTDSAGNFVCGVDDGAGTDTNESSRINNLADFECGANQKVSSFDNLLNPTCTDDNNTGGGSGEDSQKLANDFYLFNDTTQIFFNGSALNITIEQLDTDTNISDTNETARVEEHETFVQNANFTYVIIDNLNETIEQLDTDTTYTAGSNLTLSGTEFALDTSNLLTWLNSVYQQLDEIIGDIFYRDVATDSGTAVADTVNDTLTISGGNGISTSAVGDTITITQTNVYNGTYDSTYNSTYDEYRNIDTNATTECGDTQYLRGDGVCVEESTLGGDGSFNATYEEFITTANNTYLDDTNESIRFNELVGFDCPVNFVANGVHSNGSIDCVEDQQGAGAFPGWDPNIAFRNETNRFTQNQLVQDNLTVDGNLTVHQNISSSTLINCQSLNTSADGTIQCSFDDEGSASGESLDLTDYALLNETNQFNQNQTINGSLTVIQESNVDMYTFNITNTQSAGGDTLFISGAGTGTGSQIVKIVTGAFDPILRIDGNRIAIENLLIGSTYTGASTEPIQDGLLVQGTISTLDLVASGNVTALDLNATGNINADGFFLGDGSLLTGISTFNFTYDEYRNIDTNATTECGDTEFLRGDGVCQVGSTIGNDGSFNLTYESFITNLNDTYLSTYNSTYDEFRNIDTNATTECGDTQFLRGDGVCVEEGSIGGGESLDLTDYALTNVTETFDHSVVITGGLNTSAINATSNIETEGFFLGDGSLIANVIKAINEIFFSTFTTDSGSVVADTANDTITIAGGAGISTSASGSTITIDQTNVYNGTYDSTYNATYEEFRNIDTNATTECADTEFLRGDGVCQVGSTIGNDGSFNATYENFITNLNSTYPTLTGDNNFTSNQTAPTFTLTHGTYIDSNESGCIKLQGVTSYIEVC